MRTPKANAVETLLNEFRWRDEYLVRTQATQSTEGRNRMGLKKKLLIPPNYDSIQAAEHAMIFNQREESFLMYVM